MIKKIILSLAVLITGFALLFPANAFAGNTPPNGPAAPAQPEPTKVDNCNWYNIACQLEAGLDNVFLAIVKLFSNGILAGVSWLVYFAGILMDVVIKLTIVDSHKYISNNTGLEEAWIFFRNIANLTFIFILIYLGIQLILNRSGDVQKRVGMVIVAALLINFSLFFTKAAIDISNLFTLQFYKLVNPEGQSFSTTLFENLKVVKVYSFNSAGNDTTVVSALAEIQTVIIKTIAGAIIILVTACTFFVFSFLLIYRLLVIFYLLIISPLYFLSLALPSLPFGKNWPKSLIGQCLFPPIFFMFMIGILFFIRNPGFNFTIGPNSGADSIQDLIGMNIGEFIQYAILIAALIGSIKVSLDWSQRGADSTQKAIFSATNSARDWAARKTARGAGYVARTAGKPVDWAENTARRIPLVGGAAGAAIKGTKTGIVKAGGMATDRAVEAFDKTAGTSISKGFKETFNVQKKDAEKQQKEAIAAAKTTIEEKAKPTEKTALAHEQNKEMWRDSLIKLEQLKASKTATPAELYAAEQAVNKYRERVETSEKAIKKETNASKRTIAAKVAKKRWTSKAKRAAAEQILRSDSDNKDEQQKNKVASVENLLSLAIDNKDYTGFKDAIKKYALKPKDWKNISPKNLLKTFGSNVMTDFKDASGKLTVDLPADISPYVLFITPAHLGEIGRDTELDDTQRQNLRRMLEWAASPTGLNRKDIRDYLGNNKSDWLN
jgi:hypothetical protein